MKGVNFIRSILAKCELLREGVIAYAHEEGNSLGTNKWITICISDMDMYFNDKRFKALTRAWHKIGIKRGIRIVFCYCNPKEKKLSELAAVGNLIMNI